MKIGRIRLFGLIGLVGLVGAGCVTTSYPLPDGRIVTSRATGNGKIKLTVTETNGSVVVVEAEARQTETVYSALGGIAAGIAQYGAAGVTGQRPQVSDAGERVLPRTPTTNDPAAAAGSLVGGAGGQSAPRTEAVTP